MQSNRTKFWNRNNYFLKNSNFTYNSKPLKKLPLLWALQFQFNCGTCAIRQLSSLKLLRILNAYRPVAQNVFLFQMLEETSIFTLPGNSRKVPKWYFFWQYEYGFCPCILKFKLFFKNSCFTMAAWIHVGLLQSKSEMICLLKKVCLIIIHRNPTNIVDISCCHKHQQ